MSDLKENRVQEANAESFLDNAEINTGSLRYVCSQFQNDLFQLSV